MRTFIFSWCLAALSALPSLAAADLPAVKHDLSPAKAQVSANPKADAAPAPAPEAPLATPAAQPAPSPAPEPAPTASAPPAAPAAETHTTAASTPAAGGLVASSSTTPAAPDPALRITGYVLLGVAVAAVVTAVACGLAANSAENSINTNQLAGTYQQTPTSTVVSNEAVATGAVGAAVIAAFAGTALVLNN